MARLGGDEFVVILEETAERHEVERIAGELLSVLSQPLQLSGHECHTTASIGIAMYPSDGTDVQTLTKNADMAMYLAKEDGKNGFRFFTKDIKTQSIERLTLETRACAARWSATSSRCTTSPRSTWRAARSPASRRCCAGIIPISARVSPMQFIPLAEETGLIVPIGRWVLQGSLRAEHGLAAPRPAAGVDGGQSVAAAVRRSRICCRTSTRRCWRAACRRCCCSSRSPRAW